MTETDELLQERYALAYERIKEIRSEEAAPEPYRSFFSREACFIAKLFEKYEDLCRKRENAGTARELNEAEEFYEELLPGAYESSFCDPRYAASALGEEYGRLFSWLSAEMTGAAAFALGNRAEDLTAAAELFLEIYSGFIYEEIITAEQLCNIIYSYNYDYCAEFTRQYIDELAGTDGRTAVPGSFPARSIDRSMPLAGKYAEGGKYAAFLDDHKYDCSLYLDERLVTARLQAVQNTLKRAGYGALRDRIAYILPENEQEEAMRDAGSCLDKKSRKLLEKYISASCQIIERFVNSGEV
ncbi:MAG: hypothetical protein IKR00_02270 [Lachnospiraceae bacterium]|nr:hypothetical protein [Lachnospiraceae bacterium]